MVVKGIPQLRHLRIRFRAPCSIQLCDTLKFLHPQAEHSNRPMPSLVSASICICCNDFLGVDLLGTIVSGQVHGNPADPGSPASLFQGQLSFFESCIYRPDSFRICVNDRLLLLSLRTAPRITGFISDGTSMPSLIPRIEPATSL